MEQQPVMRPWTRRAFMQAMGGALALPFACGLNAPDGVAAQASPPAADAPTDLFHMLSQTPDLLPDWNRWLSFANLAQAKQMNGFGDVFQASDLGDRPLIDFSNAINGCYIINDAYTRPQMFGEDFGYDLFQISRELAMGQPPNTVIRLEGGFSPDAIRPKLAAAGYMEAMFQGITYATISEDYQLRISGGRAPYVLAHLNRIAYEDTRIVTAAATASMDAMLAGEQGTVPTLDKNPTYAALALALGDVTSMAIADNADVSVSGFTIPTGYRESLRDWGTLHPALLVAMGYTDAGDNNRTMHVAIVYANPDDADTDAPELVKRLMTYRLLRTNTPLLPMYATAVTSRTGAFMGRGVLVADITLVPDLPRAALWRQMFVSRDTLFLVPDPSLRRAP